MSRLPFAALFTHKPGTISTQKSSSSRHSNGAILRTYSEKGDPSQHVKFRELLKRKEKSEWEKSVSVSLISSKVDLDFLEEECPKEVTLVLVAVNTTTTSEHPVYRDRLTD